MCKIVVGDDFWKCEECGTWSYYPQYGGSDPSDVCNKPEAQEYKSGIKLGDHIPKEDISRYAWVRKLFDVLKP